MNQIMHRLAGERVAVKFLAEQRVAIDADSATGSDAIEGARIVEAFQRFAARKNPASVKISDRINAGRR